MAAKRRGPNPASDAGDAAYPAEMLDPNTCERARQARDARFDGRFFIGVRTTGVYCRPVCPVKPPLARNVDFYSTAAAAEDAGFRPCRRCRPETAPGSPAWHGSSATVSRALRLIGEGSLDPAGVDQLAERLGIGSRHLRRLFARHLGASPVSVARTRRVHFARRLLDETDWPMAQIAGCAGFGSVRQFNDLMRRTFHRTPSELRGASRSRDHSRDGEADGLALRLAYRAPFDWEQLAGFYASRAIPGVESVADGHYRRVVEIDGDTGSIDVSHDPRTRQLVLRVDGIGARALPQLVERVRRMFDLYADPRSIACDLAGDRDLAPRMKRLPGLRVPGAWDPFELAIRAVLGQQVSVRGATTLAGRLVETFGTPFEPSEPGRAELTHRFPSPAALAEADVASIGMPGSRADTIRGLARAVASGELELGAPLGLDAAVEQLTGLPGIGPWTAHYVALRALGEPDAFPAGDLGLRKALSENGKPLAERALRERAERWRPWRGYAALWLWLA